MNGTVWEIAKWRSVFEKAESRRHVVLTWVSMPISLTSSGYQSLLDEFQDDAPAIYGTWCVLTAFAAQCPTRGVLANSQGKPISWSTVSRVTGFSVTCFTRLAEWASRSDVAWLVAHQPLENTGKTEKEQHATNSASNGPAFAQHSTGLPNQTQPNPTRPNPTRPQPNQTKPGRNSISKNGGLAGGEDLEVWNSVAGRLAALGASRWRESVETAKAAGCSAEHVGELLDFAVARKLSVGAICFRLTRAHPSLGVELGWPDRAEKSKKSAATKNTEMSFQARKNRAYEIRTLMRGQDDAEIEKAIRAEKLEEFL